MTEEEIKQMQEENRQMSIALVRINEIVESSKQHLDIELYNAIKLYCDEEQRQDGV